MDKSLFVFLAVGAALFYFVTTFVSDIQEEDTRYQNEEYQEDNKFNKYQTTDSIGQSILDLTGTDAKTQFNAWNKSNLKYEFLELFPDFGEMRKFAQERTRGDILQKKLLRTINTVENKYFSGTITAEGAKRMLSSL
ncbi:MAG: hypothetical protein U9O24_08350 [Campylobacterota bacterium]|nr:hypothetical protein [Campylobacterota bacterium]